MTDISLLISLLAPLNDTVKARKALYYRALDFDSPLLIDIDWEGSPREFIAKSFYTIAAKDKSKLRNILEAAAEQIGLDRGDEIVQLIPSVMAWAESGASPALLRQDQAARTTVFISYSRANAVFARHLYDELKSNGFILWRDRSEMESGENWWEQIKEAIRESQTLILCLSPEALRSEVVTAEWRYARRVGTQVIPIVAEAVNFADVPHWMGKRDWLDLRPNAGERDQAWKRLITQLSFPVKAKTVPFTAPELPAHFVQRPVEFEQLVSLLLDERRSNPVAITTALQGAGGFGKTTLAIALCHDDRLKDAYDDGCLFIQFSDQPDVLNLLLDQIELLSGERPGVTDINLAASRFRELLDDRDMLVVLDNVWSTSDANPFYQRSEKTHAAFVITTRQQEVAAAARARVVKVDELTSEQTLALLTAGIPSTDADQAALLLLAEQIKGWALLAEVLGAELRQQVMYEGVPLTDAAADVARMLKKSGFDHYHRDDIEGRNRAISDSLEVSLRRLDNDERKCFYELAIFPIGIDLHFETIIQLWSATGRLDEDETKGLLRRLARMSLFTRFVPALGEVRL